MEAASVVVDRGDGHTFQFSEAEARKFIAANPGAHRVDATAELAIESSGAIAAEAATEKESADDGAPNFDGMTVEQLRTYAAEHSIDLEGATLKSEILDKVKAAAAGS